MAVTKIAREKSDKFFNSEEEIVWFKQEKLIRNDELKEILCNKFIGNNHFEIIEDLCLLPQDEIKQLKQTIVGSTIWQKWKHNIENGYLDRAERFVKWAFDTEGKKLEFIKKCMPSDVGIQSCYFLIKYASDVEPHHPKLTKEEKLVKFNKFIDFWIKPLENFYEVKNKLVSDLTDYREEEHIENGQIFMNLFSNLE